MSAAAAARIPLPRGTRVRPRRRLYSRCSSTGSERSVGQDGPAETGLAGTDGRGPPPPAGPVNALRAGERPERRPPREQDRARAPAAAAAARAPRPAAAAAAAAAAGADQVEAHPPALASD